MIKVLEVNVDDLHTGGVYSLVKNVIENNNDSNIKIDIAAVEKFQNQKNIDYLKQFDCDVYYVGSERNKILKQWDVFNNLKELITKEKYNCVHIHADTSYRLLITGMAAKNANTPNVILHSHSSGVDGEHRRIKSLVHKMCRNRLKSIGTSFVACSDYASVWMYPNISMNDVVIINNGIDLRRFRFSQIIRERERKLLGINNEILVGHVGRFLYQKNHEFLVRIIQELRQRRISAKLILVGEGPREDEIKQLSYELGVSDSVIFYGTSSKVNDLLQAFDIFILPSHFEGLPIVGVEAQAAGLPVLFSDVITREARLTENVEYLPISSDSVNRWVDGILDYISRDIDRSNAYSYLEEQGFDIQNTVNAFLSLYSKV